MGSATEYNRRDIFKRAAAITVLAAGSGSLLAACAGGSGSSDSKKAGEYNLKDAKNPFGVDPKAGLEAFIFDGGYGKDYLAAFAAIYSKTYPDAKVNQQADKDITGKLQPRFNAGSPPDVIDDSGNKQIKLDVLVKDKSLVDLAPLLDAPYIDDPSKKVRDVLMPGTIESGTIDGKVYNLSYAYTMWGLWYSGKLFKDNGWTVPKTWAEFITVCEQAKAKGIAPLAHQGKYPYYINVAILDMIAKQGGLDLMARIDKLDPTAWDDPAVKTAVEAFFQVVEKDFLLPGTNGMTHTESQTAWNQYKAVFIPSGSWLENEQLTSTPADFEMTFLPMPSLPGDKLPFEAIRAPASRSWCRPRPRTWPRPGVPPDDADQGGVGQVRPGRQQPHLPQGRCRPGGPAEAGHQVDRGGAEGGGGQRLQLPVPEHREQVRRGPAERLGRAPGQAHHSGGVDQARQGVGHQEQDRLTGEVTPRTGGSRTSPPVRSRLTDRRCDHASRQVPLHRGVPLSSDFAVRGLGALALRADLRILPDRLVRAEPGDELRRPGQLHQAPR
ncbi:N-acetylglucosamine/diacetylchitobiose ABC transporter substrate-binding protein [Kitasatospora gansuensis]